VQSKTKKLRPNKTSPQWLWQLKCDVCNVDLHGRGSSTEQSYSRVHHRQSSCPVYNNSCDFCSSYTDYLRHACKTLKHQQRKEGKKDLELVSGLWSLLGVMNTFQAPVTYCA
jgi:hypothetical protein